MHIINIPGNTNKYEYVLNILSLLKDIFFEYTFINCTESPMDEFEYLYYDGIYYREFGTNERRQIDEQNYMTSYEKDNLKANGFTLREYIDMCLLFELDRIELVPKCQVNQFQIGNIVFDRVATISICPDGLDEIQIDANGKVLNKLITSLIENC